MQSIRNFLEHYTFLTLLGKSSFFFCICPISVRIRIHFFHVADLGSGPADTDQKSTLLVYRVKQFSK